MRIRTMKFGGTSVGDAQAIKRTAELVRASISEGYSVVTIVSAMSGVTDLLIKAAVAAEAGNEAAFRSVRLQLLTKHLQAINDCAAESEKQALSEEVAGLLDYLLRLCESASVLGELTARGRDEIVSLGERMSCRIVASCLRGLGAKSEPIEATKCVVTDDRYGSANPLMEQTRQHTRDTLLPMLEAGISPVVTGFIGATERGITTTLGRGGSDFSGSLIGTSLDSEEIWIWTDVDGVLTADPRIVPEARSLPEISYAEAAELAYFGAKVLHPKTMLPAIKKEIPIRIKNTFKPERPGTVVVTNPLGNKIAARSVTAVKGLSLITVEGHGMIGVPGIAAKVFTAVAREGISVLMISQSSSEMNICFVVPAASSAKAIAALEAEFVAERSREDIDRIWAQDDVCIVAVVGDAMKGTPGVAASIFGAMGVRNINVICIAQGSSEHNLSFVIDEKDTVEAVRAIHNDLHLERAVSE